MYRNQACAEKIKISVPNMVGNGLKREIKAQAASQNDILPARNQHNKSNHDVKDASKPEISKPLSSDQSEGVEAILKATSQPRIKTTAPPIVDADLEKVIQGYLT